MADLHPEALKLLESDRLAHLVTLNDDGSPQLTAVWVGIEDGEIVSGHMMNRRKLDNVRRDPRVVLSVESPTLNEIGLREYLTVHGSGRGPGARPICSARVGARRAGLIPTQR